MRSSTNEIYFILDHQYPQKIEFLKAENPFAFLITVMLSASSTDKRAAEAAKALFSIYPDQYELKDAAVSDVEGIIHSVGLSLTKAKNIISTAKIISRDGLPKTTEECLLLPGVGEKTAACYMSTIYGEAAVIADIHFVRVVNRLGLAHSTDRAKCAKEIRATVERDKWTRLSSTVNLHGRLICKPKPKCSICPLSDYCAYVKDDSLKLNR